MAVGIVRSLVCGCLVSGVLLAATARAELVDKIAAVVNNDIIPLSEVETRAAPDLARIRQEPEAEKRTAQRAQLLKKVLDGLISERLMDLQVKEFNIEVTESEIDLGIADVKKNSNMDDSQFEQALIQEGYTNTSYRTFMRKQFSRLKLVNLKVRSRVKVSDEDVKAEYAKVSRDDSLDFEVKARQIFVELPAKPTPAQVTAGQAKAASLAAEARKPGVNFAELAKAKSEGSTASEGGDLGTFRRGVMVAEFEKVAFTLPVGGVSEPVRTKFGWHVIYVEERKSVSAQSFDDLKDQIRERLGRAALEKSAEAYNQELRAQATVEVKL